MLSKFQGGTINLSTISNRTCNQKKEFCVTGEEYVEVVSVKEITDDADKLDEEDAVGDNNRLSIIFEQK